MSKRPVRPDDLFKMAFIGDPQVSPDGRTVLFAEKTINTKNAYVTNVFSVDVATKAVRQWTQGEGGVGLARWSPNGTTIAFVSGRDKPASQIYLLSTAGGEGRPATSLPEGSIGGLKWSPDSTMIAFTFRETHHDRTQAAAAARTEKGLSDPPWEIDTLFYRADGDGYFGSQRYAVYVLDIESGTHRMVEKGDPLGSYSFDWLPDSTALLVSRSANKDPLLQKPNDQLYLVPMKGRATRIALSTKGSKSSVSVSPDGKSVAYLGSDVPSDPWGVHNTRLWTAPLTGGDPRCLTSADDYCLDVLSLSDTSYGFVADGGGSGLVAWAPDGKSILVNVGWHGAVHLASVDARTGVTTLLTKPRQCVVGGNRSRSTGLIACTCGTATRLAEIATYDPVKDKLVTLTDRNAALHDEIEFLAPTEHWVASTDGTRVHTWLLAQPPTSMRKAPAVLEIHGGPHAQYGWAMFHEFQVLAAEGYVVVYSNPRGSKGYGEAFCGAIRGDWGNKDWDDVEAVTRWMAARPEVDASRMGVMGGSYGGYMTNWVISHTNVFRAAITDRCVFNWLSAAGNSDYPLNKDGYFGGQAWGPLDKIAKLWQQSPLSHFENVKTPTLVIHSAGDLRCNIDQGEQAFFVLQSLGVESRFVRYPSSTSHGFSRNGPPDLRLHRLGEITSWWSRWLHNPKRARRK